MALCWTVEDVKNHLGLQDSTDVDIDAKIDQAMSIVLSAIERYCNRKFGYRNDFVERVYRTRGNGWQLHLWPFEPEFLWVHGEKAVDLTVDSQTGIAWFRGYEGRESVEVLYSGGYQPCAFPDDLLAVMYGSISGAYSKVLGEVSESAISKITIPDVGTITYDNKFGSGSEYHGALIGGVVPMHWQSTLDFYRLHEC